MALVDLLLRQARTRPHQAAIFHGTQPHATHAQWAARSAGLAARLRAEGLVPGDRVLLLAGSPARIVGEWRPSGTAPRQHRSSDLNAMREDILNALSSPEAAWYPIL